MTDFGQFSVSHLLRQVPAYRGYHDIYMKGQSDGGGGMESSRKRGKENGEKKKRTINNNVKKM